MARFVYVAAECAGQGGHDRGEEGGSRHQRIVRTPRVVADRHQGEGPRPEREEEDGKEPQLEQTDAHGPGRKPLWPAGPRPATAAVATIDAGTDAKIHPAGQMFGPR